MLTAPSPNGPSAVLCDLALSVCPARSPLLPLPPPMRMLPPSRPWPAGVSGLHVCLHAVCACMRSHLHGRCDTKSGVCARGLALTLALAAVDLDVYTLAGMSMWHVGGAGPRLLCILDMCAHWWVGLTVGCGSGDDGHVSEPHGLPHRGQQHSPLALACRPGVRGKMPFPPQRVWLPLERRGSAQ